jgi:hypothetical protein
MPTTLLLATFLASHMVVQHSAPWRLTGTASPNYAWVNATLPDGRTFTAAAATPGAGDDAWVIDLPAMPPSQTAMDIIVSSSSSPSITLEDVLFGETYVCSGQSNMQLNVRQTNNSAWEIARAASLSDNFRIMQVADLPNYQNKSHASEPQTNLSLSVSWGRPTAANVPFMSATCYYFGIERITRYPNMPVGMIASSWGGTAIEVWMTPKALASCGDGTSSSSVLSHMEVSPASSFSLLTMGANDVPNTPSSLWNTMLAPLARILSVSGFLWYQGESNAGNPEMYTCTQPAMISQFRDQFQHASSAPFMFVQVSAWPTNNFGLVTGIRFAQAQTLTKVSDAVGMVVAADIGDPAGAYHPIHSPFKQEVSRRLAVQMGRIQKQQQQQQQQQQKQQQQQPQQEEEDSTNSTNNTNNTNTGGPVVVSAVFDNWNVNWGAYHHGTGLSPVCGQQGWVCGGIRITFDQDIQLKGTGAWHSGSRVDSGFEIWNDQLGEAALGGTSAGSRQLLSNLCVDCSKCPCMQPLEFGGMIGKRTIQLNTTFVSGVLRTVRYGWRDYPNMVVYAADADELPAPPFNVTLSGVAIKY